MRVSSRVKYWMGGTFGVLLVAGVLVFLFWRENKMPLPRAVHVFLQTRENPENWDWFHGWRQGNRHRIFSRETRALQLSGSQWRDEESNAVLEFGDDGRMRWISKPSTESTSIPPPINQFVVDLIDGASYKFDRYSMGFYEFQDDGGSMSGDGNLKITSDPAVHARIGFDGKVLGFIVKGPDSSTPVATGPFGDVYSRGIWMYLERMGE